MNVSILMNETFDKGIFLHELVINCLLAGSNLSYCCIFSLPSLNRVLAEGLLRVLGCDMCLGIRRCMGYSGILRSTLIYFYDQDQ